MARQFEKPEQAPPQGGQMKDQSTKNTGQCSAAPVFLFQIKHRFSATVLFKLECASLKICVEAAVGSSANLSWADLSMANLSGADLSGADLSGADLFGADGKKTTIQKTPIQISGLRWHVIVFDKDMRIGCEYHSLTDWWSYDDYRIKNMDSHALDFWKQHKGMLELICVSTGREVR